MTLFPFDQGELGIGSDLEIVIFLFKPQFFLFELQDLILFFDNPIDPVFINKSHTGFLDEISYSMSFEFLETGFLFLSWIVKERDYG
jgi:hypothetical protein